ncbi:hypothetical protein CP965_12920 [Halarcobacter mediterraneus]|uniref:Formylmethanofuran dehydrogenase subunit E domain-containing protein n=1 Tax=Halarcobacter mediterraneus TaxID=2023153 RepID=A0A4Q1B1K9_9BACT|nr:FmdE family protein [Halarcobacter mediterraneus]RXK11667.1 hypothetical protein CP965_12920 [Halarcobacter mediterraneus]
MNYPSFFDEIESIKLKDDLSLFLGAVDDGIIEFTYLDIVKAAGHSCPTVAGAYIMTLEALKYLYKNDIPKRGEIKVFFKDNYVEGVTGVIANVISQVTGATDSYGFKGINGKFKRYDLLEFSSDISSDLRFQRVDDGQFIDISYDSSSVEFNPKIPNLMQKIMKSEANEDEKKEFKYLWQERVRNIFKNIDKVINYNDKR